MPLGTHTEETAVLLAQLEREMMRLRDTRDDRIQQAHEQIKEANRDFDRRAVPLGRQINELREAIAFFEPAPASRPRKAVMAAHEYEGLTDEERAHFKKLRNGAK